ncbi:hypothetical protein CS022_17640 [Veronia nyctiphanis]|uniref:Formate dehydrogenase n=1 Tax=Veronia nyctiphanis TaxID=1278244 RepID=A0A4Q0YQ17_9GAMM|nr:formate dehydrogenase subunit delta [Veronia nyctiphanis]RXJ72094.1 hypothetical protein CS022_17640 [Veronia nyctiphanis]
MDGEQHRLDQIYYMANQIADNICQGDSQDDTVAFVASHIRRFWSRDMKASLLEASEHSNGLNPIAKLAAELLAQEYQSK